MTIDVGTVLTDRFEVVRTLQSGGMGSVYEARDMENRGIRCAIKKMLEHLSEGDMAEVYRARFAAETNFLKQLCHPGIPRLLDSFILDGSFYIAMEFVPGRNLAQELEERVQLTGSTVSVEQLVRDVSQVLDILQYLHGQTPALVHRDIKPANLIREHPSGRIKLVDFGLARSMSGENKTQTQIGTLGYSPLEQLQGRSEPRSDLYALGVTMHELLTGQPPTPLSIPPLLSLRPDLDPRLAEIVDTACATRPEDRFDSAQAMHEALRALKPQSPKALPLEIERPAQPVETRHFPPSRPTRMMEPELGGVAVAVAEAPSIPRTAPVEAPEPEEGVPPTGIPFKYALPLTVVAAFGLAFGLGRLTSRSAAVTSPSPTPAAVAAAASPISSPAPVRVETPVTPVVVAPKPVATPQQYSFEQPYYRKPRPGEQPSTPRPHTTGEPGQQFSLTTGPHYPQRHLPSGAHPSPSHPRPGHGTRPQLVPKAGGLPEPIIQLPEDWNRKGRTTSPTQASIDFSKASPALQLRVETHATNDPGYRIRNSFAARKDGWLERRDIAGVDIAFQREAFGTRKVEALVLRPRYYYLFKLEGGQGLDEDQFRGEVAAALSCIDVP